MNEVLREFLLETHDNLAQLDLDLVRLEKEPTERDTLARVFRTLHTVKGTAGFLGLPKLEAVAHAAETLLARLRGRELTYDTDIATALLAAIDAVRRLLASLEKDGDEGDADFAAIIQALDRRTASTPPRPAPVVPAPAAPVPVPTPPEPSEGRGPAVSDSAVRVDVNLLDRLMTLVGELVLARNQIMQFSGSQEDAAFLGTVQRLNLLTAELQAGIMKTRMQPISNLWGKFPRIVRDLAVACGKQVRLVMDGQETELDRTIVEAIRDPLTHLVRNAIDHGIESPDRRVAAGKPVEGHLLLSAAHEGGKVIIEMRDDGAGIDPARVRDKALANKLLTPEQAAQLGERELLDLIFLPGLSTIDRVTQFSGRGVGMDVVRTNIEKIGGTVDLESRLGRGTTVRMKIPLTLAIIPALTITSSGERYAIPQVSLLELVRLEGEQAQRGIEHIHGAPVFRLRGSLLPLVYLNEQLQSEPDAATEANVVNIVVLQSDDRPFGLIVDVIHDTEEIVVKPLQKQLKGIGVFAGATIMGDGRVALILDVLGLAQRAGVVAAVRERALPEKVVPDEKAKADLQVILLVAIRDGSRLAIPLSQVARLEELPRSMLEQVGPQTVVQYRDEVLPLLDVAHALRGPKRRRRADAAQTDPVQVVVFAGGDTRVGLVVSQILDIVEETIPGRARATRPGVRFNAVVQGRVTEFLDVEALVRHAAPELIGQARAPAAEVGP